MAIYKTYRFNFIFILCLVLFTFSFMSFFTTDASAATQVTLEWSPNTEPDLAGYKVFAREDGQAYDYASPSWEGIEPTATIYNLDETASLDIDDGIAAYSWVQTGGPVVILSDVGSPQPTFTAPNVGPEGASLTFNLTVTDMAGLQDTDSSIVNISWQNAPPTAVVAQGYIEVDSGTTVTLDGSGSIDADDGIVSYQWTQVGGTPVTLSAPASAVTTFTAPETDQYGSNLDFRLTVTDAGGLQSTVDCSVYVTPSASAPPVPVNNPPVADFGYFESKLKVTFMDRSIDSDGIIVSWLWDFGDGTTNTPQSPRHRYRIPGIYTVTLTVTDDGGVSDSISKTVTVSR